MKDYQNLSFALRAQLIAMVKRLAPEFKVEPRSTNESNTIIFKRSRKLFNEGNDPIAYSKGLTVHFHKKFKRAPIVCEDSNAVSALIHKTMIEFKNM